MASHFLAQSLEHQPFKTARKHSLQIVEINTALNQLHMQIAPHIEKNNYAAATAYVNQYISHAHIWNLKFMRNLEEPEVALMQIFHLLFIFRQEQQQQFLKERDMLEELMERFQSITLYSKKHIEIRRKKMAHFIENY